jgi:hypothetical protein
VLPRDVGVVELVVDPPEEAVQRALQAIHVPPPPAEPPTSAVA